MQGKLGRFIALVGAMGLVGVRLADAGGLHGKAQSSDVSACYVWTLCEVTETVYDVSYKEETKKTLVPTIKEIKKPVSCKVCKPFDYTVLRECCIPKYKQETKSVDTVVHKTVKDECGNCHETCEVVPELVTCLMKAMVPQMVPVLQWTMVPSEQVYYETYLVQEMVEKPVTVRTLVRTPRQITTKVWKKVPTCAPCTACADSCGACTK